ncbi:MAG: TonB-dependent receptor, partial [Chitinophagaceae bacterium]
MNTRFFGLLIASIICSISLNAQIIDTLQEVRLQSRLPVDAFTSSKGVQEMNQKDLQQTNSLSVADAAKYFSGVLVKDYGGIGGLKTISVRSLGANHTGVLYDGMVMADARAGLIDLGRLSTDNLEYVRLYQSNGGDVLMPARSYASANLLVIGTSSRAEIKETQSWFSYKQGSFGFINPSAGMITPISSKVSLAVNGGYQKANGRYKFANYGGNGKSERKNGDIEQWRIEVDVPVLLADSSSLKAKLYYYQSQRGLPGSVVLYNESANERLDNTHLFAQLN